MNLFFCSTPLQLKLAIRIIETKSLSSVKLIFTGIMPNRRNEFYLKQAEELVDQIIRFDKNSELKKSRSAYLNAAAKKFVTTWHLEDAQAIYMANLNDRFYHHILSVLPGRVLYTFDDGTENVNRFSKFFNNKKYSFLRKAMQRRAGRRYWLEEVLAQTQCHYTIYKDLPNVVSNTQFIPLYNIEESQLKDDVDPPRKEIKILLGAVYRDVTIERNQAACLVEQLSAFIDKHPVDIYIPHPREEDLYFKQCKSIIPDQMSEELIIDYINAGYNVSLYGFGGSTQLNLDSVEDICNHLFESEYISARVKNGYALFNGNQTRIPLLELSL